MSSKESCSFSFVLNLLGLESRMTGVMMSAGAGAESVLRKSNARTKDNIVLAPGAGVTEPGAETRSGRI